MIKINLMEIADTVDLMLSDKDSDKLKADYIQTIYKIKDIRNKLDRIDSGKIPPNCPKDLLESQYDNLMIYKNILLQRIEKQHVIFDKEVWLITMHDCFACDIMKDLLDCVVKDNVILRVYDENHMPEHIGVQIINGAKPLTLFVKNGLVLSKIEGSVSAKIIQEAYNEVFKEN